MAFSPDEKKFVWFWLTVFGSAIGFWIIAIDRLVLVVRRLIA